MADGMTNSLGGTGEINNTGRPIACIYCTTQNTTTHYMIGTIKSVQYSPEYFTYSSGLLTFKKAVTCNVYGFGVGSRNSSGTLSTLMWIVSKNGNDNTIISKNGSGSTSDSAASQSFAANDTIAIYGKVSLNVPCGMTLLIRLP